MSSVTEKGSKSLNSFRNFSTSLMKAFSTSIFGFIITPIVIKFVGNEAYGLYKLIFDWLSNVWMFDLGMSGAFLAVAAVNFKKADVNELYGDGLKLHLKVLPLLLLASVGFYILIFNIIELEVVSFLEYSIGFWIIALTFLFYPLNVFRQYFEVSERSSLINLVTIKQLFLTNLFTAIFAYLGFGLIGICIAYASFIALGYLYIYYLSWREQKWNFPQLLNSSYGKYTEELKKTGKSYLSINISQKISFLADNTIIAHFYTPALVIPFFISQRLASLFQGQIQGLSFSGWASLIDFYNKGEFELFNLKLKEVLKLNLFISTFAVMLVCLLNERFVSLWIGDEYFIDNNFSYIVTALMLINILNFLIGHIITGTGHVRSQSRIYIVCGVLNLALSIISTKYYGFHGPVASSLLTMTALFIYKLYLIIKLYGIKLSEILILLFQQFIFVLFIVICGYLLLERYYVSSWLMLVLWGAGLSIIYLGAGFLLTFSKDEKRVWIDRVKRIANNYIK